MSDVAGDRSASQPPFARSTSITVGPARRPVPQQASLELGVHVTAGALGGRISAGGSQRRQACLRGRAVAIRVPSAASGERAPAAFRASQEASGPDPLREPESR